MSRQKWDYCFKVGACVEHERYALEYAVEGGDLAEVKCLLDMHGISCPQFDGYSLLCLALRKKRNEIAKLLLSKGADVNPYPGQFLKSSRTGDTPKTALHYAVHVDNEEIMKSLLERGANIDAKAGSRNSTPLFDAVLYRKINMIKVLLRHQADIDIPNGDGDTPFKYAAEHAGPEITQLLVDHGAYPSSALNHAAKGGKLDVVKLLLRNGASIKHYNCDPLHFAVENRHAQVAEFLLNLGADVDAECIFSRQNSHLCTAVKTGDPVLVDIVLRHRPSVKNEKNQRAVCIAMHNQKEARQGHVYAEIIEMLVSYGFTIPDDDPNTNDPYVLFVAVRNAYVNTVVELLNRGSNLQVLRDSILSNVLPLYHSTFLKKAKLATVLIQYGADITRCARGRWPQKWSVLRDMNLTIFELLLTDIKTVKSNPDLLHLAVWHGHLEIIRCLIRLGVDVNAQDEYDRTALHFCVLRRKNSLSPGLVRNRSFVATDREIVELLLSRGADASATTVMGETPLHIAAQNNLGEIVVMFVRAKVDVNAPDKLGTTALHHLARRGNVEMCEYILANGADVNARDKNDFTPLHVASEEGSFGAVDFLLEYGADIDATSKEGTPVAVACLNGHANIVRCLLENGAQISFGNNADFHSICCCELEAPLVSLNDSWWVLSQHVVKMKAANLFYEGTRDPSSRIDVGTSESNEKLNCLVEFWSKKTRKFDFRTRYDYAVAALKREKIADSNFTLYDVLTESEERVVKMSANKNLIQVLDSDDFIRRFPHFASWISRRVRKGRRLRKLREIGCEFLKYAAPELPYLCVEHIIQYLNVYDLRVLSLVWQRLT